MAKLIPLLDLDILTYELAFLTDANGNERPFSYIKKLADKKIDSILEGAVGTHETEWKGYLTGKGNYRVEAATIRPYKGTRKSEKPAAYSNLRDHFASMDNVTIVDGMEADDAICIEQTRGYLRTVSEDPWDHWSTIICTRDKDLDINPGPHYRWPTTRSNEKEPWLQTELGGYTCFFSQVLMGDSVDNIPGLYGCGAVKAANLLKPCKTVQEMFSVTKAYYQRYFGTYWEFFYRENAHLLWMLQTPDTDEILKKIDEWEEIDGQAA